MWAWLKVVPFKGNRLPFVTRRIYGLVCVSEEQKPAVGFQVQLPYCFYEEQISGPTSILGASQRSI